MTGPWVAEASSFRRAAGRARSQPEHPPRIGIINLVDDRFGQSKSPDVGLDGVDVLAVRGRQVNPVGAPERIGLG